MKNILFFLFIAIICLATIPSINADIIDPDHKQVELYYQITNINNYSDYVFLLHGTPSPSFQVLNSSQFNMYKLSTVSIYAIKKTDYNQSQLEKLNSTELENYFNNNTNLIPSNMELKGSYGAVDKASPLKKVVVQLEITSINQTNLEIKKIRAIYYYEDGTNQSADFQDQDNIPLPDTTKNVDVMWYLILPIGALIIIVLILIYRKGA